MSITFTGLSDVPNQRMHLPRFHDTKKMMGNALAKAFLSNLVSR